MNLRKELEALRAKKPKPRCQSCAERVAKRGSINIVWGDQPSEPCPECGQVPHRIRWGR